MTFDITGLCLDHSFETAEDVCRRCGLEFCELCLVYPFGANKPLCKECAMAEGGVRSHTPRSPMGRRDLRKKVKAFADRSRAMASPATETLENSVLSDPLTPTEDDLERVPAPVPAAPPVDDRVIEQLADAFEAAPLPPPPPMPAQEDPADGVAPPIDWSQPFG